MNPQWDFRKPNKTKETRDFGEGFYTSLDDREYPTYLYSYLDKVILNKYVFSDNGLRTLDLRRSTRWLMIVAFHRSSFSRQNKYHFIRDSMFLSLI